MPTIHFKGKTVIEGYDHAVPHHRFEFDARLSCLSKGQKPSLDGNVVLDGENLLVLKSLLPTHAGKVTCVYMDPPYNTGNEAWIYNDNLKQPQFKEWIGRTVGKEGEDATRHDKWCCMMYPRLKLLHELLSDNGVILVSIDDNEVHNLRMLMDEIFGENRRLGQIIWKTRNTDNRLSTNLSVDHEYVLVYAKRNGVMHGRKIDRAEFQNQDKDRRGPWVTDPLTGKATAADRPNLHHTIVNPKTGDEYPPDPSRGWITDPGGIKELIQADKIWWPPDPATGNPRKKRFLSETSERMPASTFWADVKGQSGADEVDSILGKRLFAFPKLLAFMEKLLDVAVDKEALILDPTAGSGTTGHAVLSLNKRDGGERRFVLIQQPYDNKQYEVDEVNICRDVTASRLRKAIDGYSYTEAAKGGGKRTVNVPALGGSFSYLRLGPPLFSEYRDFGGEAPSFAELAKYIFYTETSHEIDFSKVAEASGFLGSTSGAGGTSYYLLYDRENAKGRELNLDWLASNLKRDKAKNWVVYCEKLWIHLDELRRFESTYTKRVRTALVPFALK